MYPVGSCLHVLSDAFVHVCRRFLVGPVSECLEAFVFFERFQACWISQWILRNRQHVLQADSHPSQGPVAACPEPSFVFSVKNAFPPPAGGPYAPRNPVVGSSRRFCFDIFTQTERRRKHSMPSLSGNPRCGRPGKRPEDHVSRLWKRF